VSTEPRLPGSADRPATPSSGADATNHASASSSGDAPRAGGRLRRPTLRGPRFSRVRRLGGVSARTRLLVLLAVIGPGIITSNVDNDPGGITTYSLAGAHFGYNLLWMMIPTLISLIVIQEMAVRMAIVTGKGLADLIRENFGIKVTFYVLGALLLTNIFNTMSEFSGVAAGSELLGLSRYVTVPFAALLVVTLIMRGSYRIVERVFLVASLFYVAYIISAIMAKPDWNEIGKAMIQPHIELSSAYLVLMVGLVGTTIAPWMQFYIQASTVEKSVKVEELRYAQIDVTVGSFTAVLVASFIIITCGATLYAAGVTVNSAAEAAQALAPLAGKYATYLFAFGLLMAGLFSAAILPLSTSYHVCEGMGWPAGVSYSAREARQFYVLYILIVVLGSVPILFPNIPLVQIMFFSQVCNGILLPFVLIMMLRLVNNPDLMGGHVNNLSFNIVAYLTVALVILMTLASLILPFVSG
jgi:Mn2+/Fe2+ NRAMP family transporter